MPRGDSQQAVLSPRLHPGNRVRVLSPASPPDHADVRRGIAILQNWGLVVELGRHAFDRHGHYLAGRDADRLADFNEAVRDPGVRAIFCTRGGKGSYRIVPGLDHDAAARDPKPLIGYSDITILHLARWKSGRLAGFHGPHLAWNDAWYGHQAAESMRTALMAPSAITIRQDPNELTAPVTTTGSANGFLIGGTLGMIANAVGWTCPSLAGSILFIEAIDTPIGQLDRALTQLINSDALRGVAGIAVGQFIRCADPAVDRWSVVDLLIDRLMPLGIPLLGGLPIGHGQHPPTVPLGTRAILDTTSKTLIVSPAVY